MKKLYTVSIEVNGFPGPHYEEYDGVRLAMLRKEPSELYQKGMIEKAEDTRYTEDFINRELFTYKEALSIFKSMKRVFGSDVKEIHLSSVSFPMRSNIAASDACGYGRYSGNLKCSPDKEWKGPKVFGFYNLQHSKLARTVTKYNFLPDGQVSEVVDSGDSVAFSLSSKEAKKFVAAYKKAMKTGKEATYKKVTEIEPTIGTKVDIPF